MRYRFGAYTLDTQCHQLRQDGRRVPLRPKVLHVLTYLLEHRDTVVSKDALIVQVWPGQSISDETLSTCITAARRAVGDSGQAQQVIQTRHSHGYRFVATVTLCDLPPADQMPRVSLPTDAPGEPGQEWPSRVDGMTAHATSIAALPPPALSPLQQSLAGEQKWSPSWSVSSRPSRHCRRGRSDRQRRYDTRRCRRCAPLPWKPSRGMRGPSSPCRMMDA